MTPVDAVRAWVERMVVGEGLCPFAGPALVRDAVRIVASSATDLPGVATDLNAEINRLLATAAARLSTTLLVVPDALADFDDYLDALAALEALMSDAGLDGTFQLASFHPDYRFEGAPADDPAHWTNRAPYPVFQLLREAEIDRVASTMDLDAIPARNEAHLRQLEAARLYHRR